MEADIHRQAVAFVLCRDKKGKKLDEVLVEKKKSTLLTHFAAQAGGELQIKLYYSNEEAGAS